MWYNAHRNIEGEWCPAAAVPRTPCGRIIGHVAINGHGIYPHVSARQPGGALHVCRLGSRSTRTYGTSDRCPLRRAVRHHFAPVLRRE